MKTAIPAALLLFASLLNAQTQPSYIELSGNYAAVLDKKFEGGRAKLKGVGVGDTEDQARKVAKQHQQFPDLYLTPDGATLKVDGGRVTAIGIPSKLLPSVKIMADTDVQMIFGKADQVEAGATNSGKYFYYFERRLKVSFYFDTNDRPAWSVSIR